MSKFITSIPVNTEEIKKALPKGSFLGRVGWNLEKSTVEIEWENDGLKTPFTFPVEITAAQLEGKEPMPATVRKVEPTPDKPVKVQSAIVEGKGKKVSK